MSEGARTPDPAVPRAPGPAIAAAGGDSMTLALVWMAASSLCFALMAAAVKLAGPVPVAAKVFFRDLVTLGITTGVALRTRSNPLAPTPHLRRLLLRAVCGVGGVFFYFMALDGLTLADATLLNKTAPFFVAVFAVVILREPFTRALLPGLLAAFAGAVLVIKPSLDYDVLPALAGLTSGMFSGLAYVLVRSLKGRAEPNRIIFTFSLVSCSVSLPLYLLHPVAPTGSQWLALIATGVFAAGGQFGLTWAYNHGPASRISIFTYLHVLFALIVGLLLWGERPDALSLAGGLLIFAAALYNHRVGPQAAKEAR